MAGNWFFFYSFCAFISVSCQITLVFFTLQNSYFKGLLSLTVVNSNRPSFFQLVIMIDLHFDRRTYSIYTYTFLLILGNISRTKQRNEVTQGRNLPSVACFVNAFFPLFSYRHSNTMICIWRLPVYISFERKGKELLISLRHNWFQIRLL